jgi:hypothetical protein
MENSRNNLSEPQIILMMLHDNPDVYRIAEHGKKSVTSSLRLR